MTAVTAGKPPGVHKVVRYYLKKKIPGQATLFPFLNVPCPPTQSAFPQLSPARSLFLSLPLSLPLSFSLSLFLSLHFCMFISIFSVFAHGKERQHCHKHGTISLWIKCEHREEVESITTGEGCTVLKKPSAVKCN